MEMNSFFVQMSCAQKAVISPGLSEVESWTTVTSLHLLSVKTDCSHQLLHSKILSSDLSLLTPILEAETKALNFLFSVEMLE